MSLPPMPSGLFLSATMTDGANNTSLYSNDMPT